MPRLACFVMSEWSLMLSHEMSCPKKESTCFIFVKEKKLTCIFRRISFSLVPILQLAIISAFQSLDLIAKLHSEIFMLEYNANDACILFIL